MLLDSIQCNQCGHCVLLSKMVNSMFAPGTSWLFGFGFPHPACGFSRTAHKAAFGHYFFINESCEERCDEDIFISTSFGSACCLDAIKILSRVDLTSHMFCSSSICVSRLPSTTKLTVAKSKSILTVMLTLKNVRT